MGLPISAVAAPLFQCPSDPATKELMRVCESRRSFYKCEEMGSWNTLDCSKEAVQTPISERWVKGCGAAVKGAFTLDLDVFDRSQEIPQAYREWSAECVGDFDTDFRNAETKIGLKVADPGLAENLARRAVSDGIQACIRRKGQNPPKGFYEIIGGMAQSFGMWVRQTQKENLLRQAERNELRQQARRECLSEKTQVSSQPKLIACIQKKISQMKGSKFTDESLAETKRLANQFMVCVAPNDQAKLSCDIGLAIAGEGLTNPAVLSRLRVLKNSLRTKLLGHRAKNAEDLIEELKQRFTYDKLTEKERWNILHLEDHITAILDPDDVLILKKANLKVDPLVKGILRSDLGKHPQAWQELLATDPNALNETLKGISGNGNCIVSSAFEELRAAHPGKNFKFITDEVDLRNSDQREALIRALSDPGLQGPLHELVGLASLVQDLQNRIITRGDFIEQLKVIYGHNGPFKGFQEDVIGKTLPERAVLRNADGTILLGSDGKPMSLIKGTSYDSGTTREMLDSFGNTVLIPEMTLPAVISPEGALHTLQDRISGGSRNGVLKFFRETTRGVWAKTTKMSDMGFNHNTALDVDSIAGQNFGGVALQIEQWKKDVEAAHFSKAATAMLMARERAGTARLQLLKKNVADRLHIDPQAKTVTIFRRDESGNLYPTTFDEKSSVIDTEAALAEVIDEEQRLFGDPMKIGVPPKTNGYVPFIPTGYLILTNSCPTLPGEASPVRTESAR